MSLKINFVFKLANSAYPGEMSHYAAYHLGLYCLLKYMNFCHLIFNRPEYASMYFLFSNKLNSILITTKTDGYYQVYHNIYLL